MNMVSYPSVTRRARSGGAQGEALALLGAVSLAGLSGFAAIGDAHGAAIAGTAHGEAPGAATRPDAKNSAALPSAQAGAASAMGGAARRLIAMNAEEMRGAFVRMTRTDDLRGLAGSAWDGVLDELADGTFRREGLDELRARAAGEEAEVVTRAAGARMAALERHASDAGARLRVRRVDAPEGGGSKLSIELRPDGDARPVMEVATSTFPLSEADAREAIAALEAFGPERLAAVRETVSKHRSSVTLWRGGTEVGEMQRTVVDQLLHSIFGKKDPHPRWGSDGLAVAPPKSGDAAALAEYRRLNMIVWRMALDRYGVALKTERGKSPRLGVTLAASGDVAARQLGTITTETPTGALRRAERGDLAVVLDAVGHEDLLRLMQRDFRLELKPEGGVPLMLTTDPSGARVARLSRTDAVTAAGKRSPALARAVEFLLAD